MFNEQLERLPRAELKELQLKRLQEQVARLSGTAHYQGKLPPLSDGIRTLDDLNRLPFTSKKDLRDQYPLGLLAVDKAAVQRIHASSGTRGKPTIAAYTDRDLKTWASLVARCLAAVGVKPGDVLQNAYGYGLFTGGLGLHAGAEMYCATVVPTSSGRTQQQVMLMEDFAVRVICCTPSYALNIAATMVESGVSRDRLHLEIGLFGAEPWSAECRTQIEQNLGVKAYDIYGLSEVMGPGVAVECLAQDGMHVWEDHFLIEIVDPKTQQPLPPGADGELVITTLSKEAMPLLRYRTGDVCSLIETPCDCGRTSRRISRIQGRLDDMLIIRGVNVYPSEIESVLYGMKELSPQYQIVVDRVQALDQLKVRAELVKVPDFDQLDRRELQTRIASALQERLGLTATIELLEPNTLPRSEGKAHHVLDMRAT